LEGKKKSQGGGDGDARKVRGEGVKKKFSGRGYHMNYLPDIIKLETVGGKATRKPKGRGQGRIFQGRATKEPIKLSRKSIS